MSQKRQFSKVYKKDFSKKSKNRRYDKFLDDLRDSSASSEDIPIFTKKIVNTSCVEPYNNETNNMGAGPSQSDNIPYSIKDDGSLAQNDNILYSVEAASNEQSDGERSSLDNGSSVACSIEAARNSNKSSDEQSDGERGSLSGSSKSSDEQSDGERGSLSGSSNASSIDLNVPGTSEEISFLRGWAFSNNISHIALDQLLKWFKTNPNLDQLPTSSRSLLKTPRRVTVQNVKNGQFFYFGFNSTFENYAKQNPNCQEFVLKFGIDGLPLFSSSTLNFWPIMCKIVNLPSTKVFSVAIYSGNGKPDLEEFLSEFVRDLKLLDEDGFSVSGCNRIIRISILCFCCDYPAKCFIKRTKSHTGRSGCDKCEDTGVRKSGRMLFLNFDAQKRTDNSFRSREDAEHHKNEISPLTALNIDMINHFPIDYMHSVCLGIVRKTLFLWKDSGSLFYRIRGNNLKTMDERILEIKKYWPQEFSRKPRSLSCLERWKATELRQFLLYIGPVILKDILPEKYFKNFLILHFSISILVSKHYNKKYNKYAEELLKIFVKHAIKIYGQEFCIYNTHSLLHLAEDANRFGSLDLISCFEFENYLQVLKNLVRTYSLPLQQVVNRIFEHQVHNFEKGCNKISTKVSKPLSISEVQEHISNNIQMDDNTIFYKELACKGAVITEKLQDSIVILEDKIIVRAIAFFIRNEEVFVLGKECKKIGSVYNYPQDSTVLNIHKIVFEEELKEYSESQIYCKGVLLPINDELCCFPFLHFDY